VGCLTAIFAATIGLVQNDIKKILAYSTISQLGYMFLALGVGAFTSGVFHLITHAFFKALLFLGAGCVIHALKGEQDIRRMGGLGSAMPRTRWTFLAGSLAIAGIPPLSGFFSKDEILLRTFAGGATLLWIIGWITAGLTAFYIFRLFFLAFAGDGRWAHDAHPHEMPGSMTLPLVILSILSIAGGMIGIPASLGGGDLLGQWLEPIFSAADGRLASLTEAPPSTEYVLIALSIGIAAAGVYGANFVYRRRANLVEGMITRFHAVYSLVVHKYYVDEVYDALIVSPLEWMSTTLLWKGLDVKLIDGVVDGTASLVLRISGGLRRIQSGVAQGYALVFVLGIIVILGILVLRF
jgi:NADH-quinone oxidoreductase subunit L